jgi:hypothetical protein
MGVANREPRFKVNKLQKIDPDFKTKWVKALRSGRYRQARTALRREDSKTGKIGYCCLGVACNVLNHRAWRESYQGEGVYDWGAARTTTTNLPFVSEDIAKLLVGFNDDDQLSFREIADWIDLNL